LPPIKGIGSQANIFRIVKSCCWACQGRRFALLLALRRCVQIKLSRFPRQHLFTDILKIFASPGNTEI
jgi:hypothetical protein